MTEASNLGQTPEVTSKAEHARQVTERAFKELSEQLAAGNSQRLDAFLTALARFHRYSFNNVMLILTQKPDATRVAGFHTWRSLGRSVKKGEKGIAIFAPMLLKSKQDETKGADEPDKPPRLRFRVVHVFDLSQTDGEPLPEPELVGGDPGEYLTRLEAAVRSDGIRLEDRAELGGAEGLSTGGLIVLREGQSPAERFSTLTHEWAHEILHQRQTGERPPKTVRETEAEAVAFIVCQAIGLDTGTASSDYIRLYRGEPETLMESLDRIQKTACRILEAVLLGENTQHSGHGLEADAMTASLARERSR